MPWQKGNALGNKFQPGRVRDLDECARGAASLRRYYASRRVPFDPDDVRTWGRGERSAVREGRSCEWPGGCGRDGKLNLDHDHLTHRLRGVLCDFHNQRLGVIEDLGAAATEYLARYGQGG